MQRDGCRAGILPALRGLNLDNLAALSVQKSPFNMAFVDYTAAAPRLFKSTSEFDSPMKSNFCIGVVPSV
jgi:hypothetical protein